MSRSSIDPQMPFIQVDRAALHSAALLAPNMDITGHHALGAMVSFWAGLADRRLLTPLVLAGKRAMVLSVADLSSRLRLAFGRPVPLELLVAAGFLEEHPDGYRVRGMSRYINAEAARLSRKKGADGTPVARDATVPEPGSHPGGTPVAPRSDPPSDPGPTPVAPHRGKRIEGRVESFKTPQPPAGAVGELQDRLLAAFEQATGTRMDWRVEHEQHLRRILHHGDDEVLRRWRIGLRTPFPKCWSLKQLADHWDAYVSDPPKPGTVRELSDAEIRRREEALPKTADGELYDLGSL